MSQNDRLRVVITTAFPTATFLKTDHMSRFILASTPVLNSSMSKFVGFPTYREKRKRFPHEDGNTRLTHHGDSKSKLTLISSRQLTSQPIRVFSQSSSLQQSIHVLIELWSTRNTFQSPIHLQMFPHGQLSVNCCELRANTQRESRGTRVLDNRDLVDKDISFGRRNIAPW